jgi:hypothetical protein
MQLEVERPAIIEHRAVSMAFIITLQLCFVWSVMMLTS